MIAAIIGANYGDEGKGLMVDYLSSPTALVVRHNGGAQAGHTVVTPDGNRHVFSHLGAGTLRGARTLLSRFFICNPVSFGIEWSELCARGCVPAKVLVDEEAMVTTPYDVAINRALELQRGQLRHGSCGIGIHETVCRCIHESYNLRVRDLLDLRRLRTRLGIIRDQYAPMRSRAVGVQIDTSTIDEEVFIERATEFIHHSLMVNDESMLRDWDGDIIFEGAQGLRLDACATGFPHVTRSRTGLTNVTSLLTQSAIWPRIEYVDVVYVTRSYLTRHGAGPLANECSGHPYGWTGGETNVMNTWQGALRYAPMNVSALVSAIRVDISQPTGRWRPCLAVTCLDQSRGSIGVHEAKELATEIGLPLRYVSFGPTRNDVKGIHGMQSGRFWRERAMHDHHRSGA